MFQCNVFCSLHIRIERFLIFRYSWRRWRQVLSSKYHYWGIFTSDKQCYNTYNNKNKISRMMSNVSFNISCILTFQNVFQIFLSIQRVYLDLYSTTIMIHIMRAWNVKRETITFFSFFREVKSALLKRKKEKGRERIPFVKTMLLIFRKSRMKYMYVYVMYTYIHINSEFCVEGTIRIDKI